MMRKPKGKPHRITPKATDKRPTDPDYLTIDEFCSMFAISLSSWKHHRPYLRKIKFGVRTLIPREEALRYAESLAQPAEKARAPKGLKQPESGLSKGRI
jgi:hypothetical protein